MGLTDAVVAVAIHPLTWVPIVQVHIGWAVRTGTRAELWEVAGIAGVPARRSRRFQLEGEAVGGKARAALLGEGLSLGSLRIMRTPPGEEQGRP